MYACGRGDLKNLLTSYFVFMFEDNITNRKMLGVLPVGSFGVLSVLHKT
jgi:hypothetical protein